MGCDILLRYSYSNDTEPGAMLQHSTSGEYLNYQFFDWRDVVHYQFWCNLKKYDMCDYEIYQKWCKKYGYDEEEEFNGKYSEFKGKIKKISPAYFLNGTIEKISCDDDYENMTMLQKISKKTIKKKNYKFNYTLIKCDYFDRLFSDSKLMKHLSNLNEYCELGYVAGYDKKKKKKIICVEKKRFKNDASIEEENNHIDEIFKFVNDNSSICGGGYIVISRNLNSNIHNDLKSEIYDKICASYGSSVEGLYEINSKTQLAIVNVDAESG